MDTLFEFLFTHTTFLIIALVAAVAMLVVWLILPPTWKSLDRPDFTDDDSDTFFDRLWRGRW